MIVRRYTKVYEVIADGVSEPIFPRSDRQCEAFRTVSHVVLQRRAALAAAWGDGTPPKLVVSNLFVCSGQKHHKVPGKKAATKVKFNMRVVTNGIQKAVRFAPNGSTSWPPAISTCTGMMSRRRLRLCCRKGTSPQPVLRA